MTGLLGVLGVVLALAGASFAASIPPPLRPWERRTIAALVVVGTVLLGIEVATWPR